MKEEEILRHPIRSPEGPLARVSTTESSSSRTGQYSIKVSGNYGRDRNRPIIPGINGISFFRYENSAGSQKPLREAPAGYQQIE
jgi:hypothetical protein